jgi:hypothetical protein
MWGVKGGLRVLTSGRVGHVTIVLGTGSGLFGRGSLGGRFRNISSTNEMLHTDINARAQRTRVSSTHAQEATSCHKSSHAINQLNRHRRQPAPILQ